MTFKEMINKFPDYIVEKLKLTTQNEKYHPEITTYNHIWLVWETAHKISKDLGVCSIFHDLGKCDCSREKLASDGQIHTVSYGHENYAKHYLDEYLHLFDYDDKDLIYYVCQNHMRAHLYSKMRKSKQEEMEKSPYFEALMKFAECDDMDKISVPKFIMTISPSGAGKSYWSKPMADKGWNIVNPDLIRKELTGDVSDQSKNAEVWKIAKERVVVLLKEGKNVILDSTMTTSKSRKQFLKDLPICVPYAKVFEIPYDVAWERIQNALKAGEDRSNVPEDVLKRQYHQFEADKDKIPMDGLLYWKD